MLACSCAKLVQYGRMLTPGVSLRAFEKLERVDSLLAAAQAAKYGLAGENRKAPIVATEDFAACGTRKKFVFSRTLGERIVCALDVAYARNKSAADATYAQKRVGKACKVAARYGAGDGADCARGFEEKDGCCFARMFRAQEAQQALDTIDRDPDLSSEQKAASKAMIGVSTLPELDVSEKAQGVVVAFVAATQAQLFSALTAYFEDVVASSPEEWDACKDDNWWNWTRDGVKWAASVVKGGVSSVLKFLYKVLERVGGVWLFRKGRCLIGKTWQAVSTKAQRLAAFIATHPMQAKAMLAGFKFFRDAMATEVAQVLDQVGVFGDVNELYKNATPVQQKWFCAQAHASINGGGLVQHVLQSILSTAFGGKHQGADVLNVVDNMGLWNPITWLRFLNFDTVTNVLGAFLGSVVGAIPVVGSVLGPVVAVLFSKIGTILGDVLAETAKTIMYVNDIKDCLFLIVDILDITPCLEKWGPIQLKYPDLWMILSMIRRSQKMTLSDKTQDAVEGTRATLNWAIKDAIGRAQAFVGGEEYHDKPPPKGRAICTEFESPK